MMNLEITNPLYYGVPFFFVLIISEYLLTYKHDKDHYNAKDFWSSFQVAITSGIVAIFTKTASIAVFYMLYKGFADLRVEWLGYQYIDWTIWWVWVLLILADDLCFYWYHRLSHTVRVLWAAHVVHHSSEQYNFGNAIRNGIFTLFYKSLFWLWLPILGFHPVMVVTVMGVSTIYQYWLHSSKLPKLGVMEEFMNTPKLHAVHHSRNIEYLDKNHAAIFMFWDRLFGTYKAYDDNVPAEFGVIKGPNSNKLVNIVFHEYRDLWQDVKNAKTWQDKFMYLFSPPGWSPDGSTKTTKQIQKELEQEKQLA
ncbi:sterol desaturase family protein [Microscilla marina]|uniref:Sterol desaturase family protein n=1 Tax=Microscilla marina ATCC 23134 TaxID=313606 RepID=A1ZG84_MICM2|nr:sterol desaturase family protein [Microscilla marina]EAY30501.1 sterol desaturase family protein [Microscilla marina ATCC 23134]